MSIYICTGDPTRRGGGYTGVFSLDFNDSLKSLSIPKGDSDLGKEAAWCAPQRLCPHHHPQPHRLLHQLLQGEISEI